MYERFDSLRSLSGGRFDSLRSLSGGRFDSLRSLSGGRAANYETERSRGAGI